MATDLEQVYFESLTPRQLNRRLEDALGTLNAQSQSQTQGEGVMVGIGDEGERLLRESVDALITAVADGSARVDISHEAFEVRRSLPEPAADSQADPFPPLQHIVSVTVPSSFTMRFLTTSLEHQSSAALAAHLVTPLLGVCSSLLALLRDASTDDADLLRRVETAIDGSGQAERMQEGRAARRFMGVGGPALLGRWLQRSLGAKEKDLRASSLLSLGRAAEGRTDPLFCRNRHAFAPDALLDPALLSLDHLHGLSTRSTPTPLADQAPPLPLSDRRLALALSLTRQARPGSLVRQPYARSSSDDLDGRARRLGRLAAAAAAARRRVPRRVDAAPVCGAGAV